MTVFTDKCKKYVPRLMLDLQISREQACGIFGNIGGETGGFMALQEIKPTVAGSRGGYGWLQWTGPRRRKYEAWVKAKGLNPAADETNYQYLVFETKTDEVHSLMQLRKTTTVEAATETFMRQNLRPGAPHLEGRIKWAKLAEAETRGPVGETATTVAAGGGAAVAMTQSEPKYWIWIIGAAVAAAVIGWIVVRRVKSHEAEQAHAEVQAIKIPKKGKKNVKAKN